ncbi:hypothetical protein X798_02352 [Onchocerca flexuosa]|uniref:MAM domain-containing protein n=2 Tax=Onchocerca flexuosa TaxID=387005 RepID=A0A238BZC1_9BILA|nr:hypothetical protein X798_02352 [Onchocerca flexuosa]
MERLSIPLDDRMTGKGCLPPPYYGTYSPYPPAQSGGLLRPYADSADFNNAINDEHPSLFAAPSNLRENLDVIQVTSDLNCHGFDRNCRWSNTNEDELDWKVLISTPEAEPLVSALQTAHLPDASAAVLLSGNRNTYDSGQLVSDLLPCIVAPLQLTATVWRTSSDGPFQQQQPNLKICSRNTHKDQPYSNCNLFPIQNGIPVTVNIPGPRDPTTPAQIVLLGDNFVGKHGAIFMQNIIVDGDLVSDCAVIPSLTKDRFNKPQRQQARRLISLNNFQDSTSPVKVQELNSMQKIFNLHHPSKLQLAAPLITDSLMVECLKLSCNPAEKNCDWQNSIAGWTASTGTDGFSNPLTGIMVPPAGTNAFLVASYNRNSRNPIRQIISPMINIPISAQPIYFCFFEYFALEEARFTMCIDAFRKGCFYSKIGISKNGDLQKSRQWNFQCTELPVGTYKIYVSAENNGPNQGDIGFVPLRLSRDLAGNDPVC